MKQKTLCYFISRFSYNMFYALCVMKRSVLGPLFFALVDIDKFLSRSEESNKLMSSGKFIEYLLYIYTLVLTDQIESFIFEW